MNRKEKIPLVSVIMPVYNTEKYLPDVLESILNQTYENLEIVIVNNGSAGNVKALFVQYQETCSQVQWRLVNLAENVGLFAARAKGYADSHGEYIVLMDSDDLISQDFVYQLLKKAEETGADMVMTDYVNDFVGDAMKHYALNPAEHMNFTWTGQECLRQYFRFRGGCFNFHAVWNRIYRRDLWERAWKEISSITEPLVLCEDVLYSTLFFAYARKVVNIHGCYYYHAVHQQAESINIANDHSKIERGMHSSARAFEIIEDFLKRLGRFEEVKQDYQGYRKFIFGVIFNSIHCSSANPITKKQFMVLCCKIAGEKKAWLPEFEEYFFESLTTQFNNNTEVAYTMLRDETVEYVSFDIFDTLLERPFYGSADVFWFLSEEWNRLHANKTMRMDFGAYRRQAEQRARAKVMESHKMYEEVQLAEIYQELVEEQVCTGQEATWLMEREIALEKRFCKPREIGKLLYDFALQTGKKLICISDMYLPKAAICELLEENGYTQIEEVFVSSDQRLCKHSGKLFQAVLRDLHISDPRTVLHVGDNLHSDIEVPNRLGMRQLYVPAAREALYQQRPQHLLSKAFGVYDGLLAPREYQSVRCMMGLIANRFFGNPFQTLEPSSDFDANPHFMGYATLGPYLFTLARWLMEQVKGKGYGIIHFIARDGYLVKQAYDLLTKAHPTVYPKSNYFYTSRKATMPLMAAGKQDLWAIKTMVDIFAYTPLKFVEEMKAVIAPAVYETREQRLEEEGFLPAVRFSSEEQWDAFIKLYREMFFDEELVTAYRVEMKKALATIIGPHDCTFDAGYSGRTESVLSQLLGYPVDGYYIFCNQERGMLTANQFQVTLSAFHRESADILMLLLLESFLCSTDGSCIGYELENGTLSYCFGTPQFDRQTRFVLNLLQQSAIEFVSDMVSTFPEECLSMPLRYDHGAAPFMALLKGGRDFDRRIFAMANFADSNSSYQSDTLYEEWGKIVMQSASQGTGGDLYIAAPIAIEYASLWKKSIYYAVFDRKTLKEKARRKLSGHPIVFRICKACYSIPREIYHLFRK